jgi:hypothetical protein
MFAIEKSAPISACKRVETIQSFIGDHKFRFCWSNRRPTYIPFRNFRNHCSLRRLISPESGQIPAMESPYRQLSPLPPSPTTAAGTHSGRNWNSSRQNWNTPRPGAERPWRARRSQGRRDAARGQARGGWRANAGADGEQTRGPAGGGGAEQARARPAARAPRGGAGAWARGGAGGAGGGMGQGRSRWRGPGGADKRRGRRRGLAGSG